MFQYLFHLYWHIFSTHGARSKKNVPTLMILTTIITPIDDKPRNPSRRRSNQISLKKMQLLSKLGAAFFIFYRK